jgi:hypothetical protein
VGTIDINDDKNAGALLAIYFTMGIWWYDAACIAQSSTSRASLEAMQQLDAAIGQVPMPYCPSGHCGWQFWCKTLNIHKTQLSASQLMVDQSQ